VNCSPKFKRASQKGEEGEGEGEKKNYGGEGGDGEEVPLAALFDPCMGREKYAGKKGENVKRTFLRRTLAQDCSLGLEKKGKGDV